MPFYSTEVYFCSEFFSFMLLILGSKKQILCLCILRPVKSKKSCNKRHSTKAFVYLVNSWAVRNKADSAEKDIFRRSHFLV